MANSRSITVKVAEDGNIILDEELSMLKQMRELLMKSLHGFLVLYKQYGMEDPMTHSACSEFYKYLRFANDTASIINYEFEADLVNGTITFKKV